MEWDRIGDRDTRWDRGPNGVSLWTIVLYWDQTVTKFTQGMTLVSVLTNEKQGFDYNWPITGLEVDSSAIFEWHEADTDNIQYNNVEGRNGTEWDTGVCRGWTGETLWHWDRHMN